MAVNQDQTIHEEVVLAEETATETPEITEVAAVVEEEEDTMIEDQEIVMAEEVAGSFV